LPQKNNQVEEQEKRFNELLSKQKKEEERYNKIKQTNDANNARIAEMKMENLNTQKQLQAIEMERAKKIKAVAEERQRAERQRQYDECIKRKTGNVFAALIDRT
jgi:hypothetical protein